MKKPIIQKHGFGCGVACVAFVLHIPYQKALKLFKDGKKKAERQGFLCREIVEALKFAQYKYINKRKTYKENDIVFIKRSKKYPAGHYLARYKNLWMDPWLNFPKDKNIKNAKSGFRKKLPGRAIYLIR